jgi:hypothetical protein
VAAPPRPQADLAGARRARRVPGGAVRRVEVRERSRRGARRSSTC